MNPALATVYRLYPTNIECLRHVEQVLWAGVPSCPYCHSHRSTAAGDQYHCNACNANYRVTVYTVFHGTHVPLQQWFLALALILNADRRIPSRRLAQMIELNRDTAWRLSRRINAAVLDPHQRLFVAAIAAPIASALQQEVVS
jgi:transposase-like protein